jgi:cytochrome bd ubiquinol oxidase subunit I
VATSLVLFVLVYGVVFSFGIYFINRLIAGGIREAALPEQTPQLAAWPSHLARMRIAS